MYQREMSDSGWALYIILHHVPKKDIRSKGGLEPLFNEKSIGLKPTLQTPEAHRCPFIIISQWNICNTICMLLQSVNFKYI